MTLLIKPVSQTEPEPKPPSSPQSPHHHFWWKLVRRLILVVLAVVVGLEVRFGAYESMQVVSGSMEPTLQLRQRFLVDHRASLRGHWQRGDVVLFAGAEGTNWPAGDTYVKRVIGLPGETWEMKAGQIYINGNLIAEPYLKEPPAPDSLGPIDLGATQYFLMGDNRNNSDDSRMEGPVEGKTIKGRVVLRYWPLSDFGFLDRPDYNGVKEAP